VGPPERHHALSEAEVDLERRRWDLQQKASAPAAGKGLESTIMVRAPDEEMHELRSRLTELEEQMEQATEERNRLNEERAHLATLQADVKDVMKILDDLLGELSEEKIRTFAKSDKFALYEKVLDRLEL